ncbi:amidase [Pseudomonas sp. 10B1]|uniref:amidase n=1 Tax=unclassified Pseudomonas TaxID=196821 RepID=UPI002B2331ED|nr:MULTISPECIES: amidase [unclassified Pseudomonas]MEA9994706.1 amidase [Pseudomonas sp. AA4]MEB0086369.1 amidase [Pseudomonas sp. RTI1]MEB0126432.1 amidase [Pseudomonas sp. CCC1.2]MEB0155866.1 amidase [Pseudomonas sp. CCC4.3]MEB0219773.1 amidase [Pseudomonas sp. AB12(2023)]
MDTALNARLLAALPPRSSIPLRDRIVDYEIAEMATLFRSHELTSHDITVAYLQRIDQLNGPFETYSANGGYNAFVRIDRQQALAQAREADLWLQNPNDERGVAPPLCGIPMGLKDSIGIKGRESKNGTQAYNTNFALEDATCVGRLRAQGAVLIGHTICSEHSGDVVGQFAGNAWDPERPPGGSSQGSAVAPIARLVAAALGEETAGSIIIPAAVNGVSAIKPSLGLVSGAGVMPLRTGFDIVGPMARSMRDASLILSVIAGVDQLNDPQTLSAPIPPIQLPISSRPGPQPLAGLTIGIPQTDWLELGKPPSESYDLDNKNAFDRFKGQLSDLGAAVVNFPGLDLREEGNSPYLWPTPFYELVDDRGQPLLLINGPAGTSYCNQLETNHWTAILEFANSLQDADQRDKLLADIRPDFYSIIGRIPLSVRIEAENRRRQQQRLFEEALDQYNIDFMMVLPIGAHIGLRSDPYGQQIPVRRHYVELPNALAWPMVTFPIGYGDTGLISPMPISAAFWGRRFSEPLVVQAAIDFQDRFPEYHRAAPTDPTFGPRKKPLPPPLGILQIPPEFSTDPVKILEGRRTR